MMLTARPLLIAIYAWSAVAPGLAGRTLSLRSLLIGLTLTVAKQS